jgi:formylglycine-generating enzyme required for sulfatase activity
MIEKLVATLEQKMKDLTSEEIADILWLTLQQWQSDLSQAGNASPLPPDSVPPQVETLVSGNTVPIPPPSGEVVSSSVMQKPETAGITTQKPQNKSEPENSADLGAPLAIPDSPSLRRSLDILRAIRPLIRLVPSAVDTFLDVPATVKTIAETEILTVKLRPLLEPWLELALVVDATPSMVIWQRTILNLRRVLAQSGVFRDVRLWSLETVDSIENIPDSSEQRITQRLCIRSGFGTSTASQPPCRPQELLDPNGRRLILVVSDCIDPRWDAQPIRDLLQVWANHGAMGLVQVLPEWLWSRTALSQVTKGQMVGIRPGQPSQSLTFVRRKRSLRSQPVGVKVPVMTLEPDVTNRWSQMVAGKSSVSSPGLVFSPVRVQELADDAEFDAQESTEPTPQERLAQFRAYSSPMARQLAGLLAACPEVNLPVVRMVQEALLPDSQQVNVAEVLLGGLFKSQTEITAYTPADRVQYVFHDGVKPLVQETISPKQAFNALSAWVKRRFGYALEDFRAYLTEDKSEEIQPFAGVMLDVLNRQSSQNVELIERIKEVSGLGKSDEVDKLKEGEIQSDFPELEVLTFTTARLVEEETLSWYPPLQTEEYTVATIALETVLEYQEALRAAQAIQDEYNRAEALREVATQFPEGYLEALRAAQAIQDEYNRAKSLSALEAQFPGLYLEALRAAQAIQDESERDQILSVLGANLPQELTYRTVILKPFNFKIGSIVKSGDDWVVQKSEGKAYRYVEQIDENVVLEMVSISGGVFMMGSPENELERSDDESPQHLVTVPDFYMGRYPVTQVQWRAVAAMPQVERELNPDPSNFKGDDRPIEQVSWEDAIEFCARLSNYTNRQYRLPTEAEWEYACRAGTTTPFHFGETISPELANYNGTAYADGPTGKGRGGTTTVEHFDVANAWGLCDMHGNVREWCEDYWHGNYEGAPEDGSAWLTNNPDNHRVNRGGSWSDYPRSSRTKNRYYTYPVRRNDRLGFRVSCSDPETSGNLSRVITNEEVVTPALAMARRSLAILEEQAAGFGKLQMPAHLRIELEEKRLEVAELEARLRDGANNG